MESCNAVKDGSKDEGDPDSRPKAFNILLLGEGDFSFTRALCRILWENKSDRDHWVDFVNCKLGLDISVNSLNSISITSTSFDSKEEVNRKYPGATKIIEEIKSFNVETLRVEVVNGVNACELKSSFGSRQYNVIIWNHPHLGIENSIIHRFLIAHLFHSAKQVLTKCGRINISLVTGQEERWGLLSEVPKFGFALTNIIPFLECEWLGYVCRRNKSGDSFKNSRTRSHYNNGSMESFLYQFSLASPNSSVNPTEVCGTCIQNQKADAPLNQLLLWPKSPLTPRKKKILESVPKDLVCIECKRQLRSTRGYTQHMRSVHELNKFGEGYVPGCKPEIPCPVSLCKRRFRKASDLSDHLLSKHTAVFQEPCPDSNPSLQGNAYGYYPCEICGQAVSCAPTGLAEHMDSFRPIMGLSLKCKNCMRSFIESRSLEQHSIFCNAKNNPVIAFAPLGDLGSGSPLSTPL